MKAHTSGWFPGFFSLLLLVQFLNFYPQECTIITSANFFGRKNRRFPTWKTPNNDRTTFTNKLNLSELTGGTLHSSRLLACPSLSFSFSHGKFMRLSSRQVYSLTKTPTLFSFTAYLNKVNFLWVELYNVFDMEYNGGIFSKARGFDYAGGGLSRWLYS